MNDSQQAAVRRVRQQLVDDINYEHLKTHLRKMDAVSFERCQRIEHCPSGAMRTLNLLEHLVKIDSGWELLHNFLRENDQNHLSELLHRAEVRSNATEQDSVDGVDGSFSEIAIGLQYSRNRLIGSGASGNVYEGRFRVNYVTHIVAIKIYTGVADDNMEETATKLHQFNHKNIVKMWGVRRVFDPPQIALVLEKGDRSLASALREGNIGDIIKFKISEDITSGLVYLHGLQVVHRDFKPHNILLFNVTAGRACVAKLVDFDFCHQLRNSTTITDKWRGTPQYMAPELLRGQGERQPAAYGTSVDIYALAMTLYELFTEQTVFEGLGIDNDFALMFKVGIADERPAIPANVEYSGVRGLIERCWVKEPGDRPAAMQVYEDICVAKTSHTSHFNYLGYSFVT